MPIRAPHLYPLLRGFVLGAFVLLGRELEEGGELPFAFEEHVQRHGPALYELRPLVRAFIDERASVLRRREDALLALEELRREPAAAIFANAHAGPRATEDDALFRTVLLGLLVRTAESCGGFDWDDESFERAYAELESSLFGEGRRYAAIAPLVGISAPKPVDLASGLRLRPFVNGELAAHWPESRGLLPPGFGREPDRYCVLELERELEPGAEPPDSPGEIADAVSAIRLTTAAALAAGPVLFEILDGRPFGIRPVLPIAASQPPGEASRLDGFRTPIAVEVLTALAAADGDPELAEALDRWELSLFQNEPFRSERPRRRRRDKRAGSQTARRAGTGRRGESGRGGRHPAPRGRDPPVGGSRGAAAEPRPAAPRARATAAAAHGRLTPIRRRAVSPSRQVRRYFRFVEEARAVLERLVRIERLRREGALPEVLLDELRALLCEAEEWSRVEGGDAGERAVAGLRDALARDMIEV